MIRLMEIGDLDIVGEIVNGDWKNIYSSYINPDLLSLEGCKKRKKEIEAELLSGSLANYIYEDDGIVKALLTFGQTADSDKSGAFEIWRIYVSQDFQGVGIGKSLLTFAEKQAMLSGFQEIIIWAFKENFKAVSFYKHNGYVEDKVMNLEILTVQKVYGFAKGWKRVDVQDSKRPGALRGGECGVFA